MALFSTGGKFGSGAQNPQWMGGWGGSKAMANNNWWGGNRDTPQTPWSPWEYASGGGRFGGTGGPRQSWGAGASTKNATATPGYSGSHGGTDAPPGNWPVQGPDAAGRGSFWNLGTGTEGVNTNTTDILQGTGGGGGSGGGNGALQALLAQLTGGVEGPEFNPWGGFDYNVPGGWNPDNYDIPELRTDPWEVINSSLPWLDEQRQTGFSGAAARMGKTGMLSSTPYAQALGQVERKTQDDLARLTQGNLYDASKFNANMEQTQRENALNRALQGWQTHGGWDVGLQQQAGNQDYGAWGAENDWGLNKYGLDMQNQGQMFDFLMQMLPYLQGGG